LRCTMSTGGCPTVVVTLPTLIWYVTPGSRNAELPGVWYMTVMAREAPVCSRTAVASARPVSAELGTAVTLATC